jgi:hypothetical protein
MGASRERESDRPPGRIGFADHHPELEQLSRPRAPWNASSIRQRRRRGKSASTDEKTFRWMHNEDAMATEKLAEGSQNSIVTPAT